jgi:Uma2 family endonuclease
MSTIDRSTAAVPLEAGQRLDRATFHERYEKMPPGTRAELIGGVVYMPSPVGLRHSEFHALAVIWLGLYRFRTPGVAVADNASTALDDLGEPQPDASLRVLPTHGGRTQVVGNIIGGGPELIVEVAQTSRGIDLGVKRADYERAGVLEYIVFALNPDEVIWHVRRDDRLVRVPPGPDGLYRSEAFPGLWLDPRAFLDDNGPALVATLEQGLATDEHAAFVARLTAAGPRT